jgi:hypothetical protein
VLSGLATISLPDIHVSVSSIDLAHLNIEDQLQLIADTDVLVRPTLCTGPLHCPICRFCQVVSSNITSMWPDVALHVVGGVRSACMVLP